MGVPKNGWLYKRKSHLEMDDNWGYLYLGNPQAFHVDVPFEKRLPIEVPHCAHGLRLSQGGQVATGAVANGVDLPHAGVLIPHSAKYTKKKRRMEVYPKMDENGSFLYKTKHMDDLGYHLS